MKLASEITACVIDKGIFLPVARRLAREYDKVYYWTPHEKAFPVVSDIIGDGFPEIELVENIWEVKDKCDLFVFPDIGFAGLQQELISQGKAVWGARDADKLEVSRGKFLETLLETDLPLPKFQKIQGMTALRDFLRDKEDRYIKISKFRGDWETLHWRNWSQDESELDYRSVKLGPWKEAIVFYVFDPIDTEIEDGVDTYCVDGQWPKLVIHGMEAKDKAYIGTFQAFEDLPEEVRRVNNSFGPILGRYNYRSFFSTEVRITKDDESYFIDPTTRAGSPPSQVMCEMVANLGDIIWQGANGVLVEPEPFTKFGVQALLSVKGERHSWSAVEFDDEVERWVKCGFCSLVNGRMVFPPDHDSSGGDIGWLVGVGDNIEEALKHLKHNVKLLPDGVCCDTSGLTDLLGEIQEAEAQDLHFCDERVPDPVAALPET